MLRPEMQNQFSVLCTFLLQSKLSLSFTYQTGKSAGRFAEAEAATCWSLLWSCRHAKAPACGRLAITLSPLHSCQVGTSNYFLQGREDRVKNYTQPQQFGKS